MTFDEIKTDAKAVVFILAAALFVDMILCWACETEYWQAVAEAFRNL